MATSDNESPIPIVRVRNREYWLHTREPATPWKILVLVDGNEQAYVPFYQTCGKDGTEDALFSLLPADGCGDTLLVQIRIHTQGNSDEGKASVPYSVVSTQSSIPASLVVDAQEQHVLITLSCLLEARPQEHRLIVRPEEDITVEFRQEVVEDERRERTERAIRAAREESYVEGQLDREAYEHSFAVWIARGKQAYDDQEYQRAQEYFDMARRRDQSREAEAYVWYALAYLQENELEKATHILSFADEKRAADLGMVAATEILAEWSSMCLSPSLPEFIANLRDTFDENDEKQPFATLERYAHEWGDVPQRAIFDALLAYLQGDPERSLQILEGWADRAASEHRWLATFWLGMAYGATDRREQAFAALQDALSQGMPPVLLLPLRWFRDSNAEFFDQVVKPLFKTYALAEAD